MASRQFKYENEPTPGNQVATTRSLLDLSTEVLIDIFVYLPAADMITVQHTCRTTRDIVTGTVYLQYALHTRMNGVDDLLPPDFPYSERLELLRCHEQSWRDLQFHRFAEYPDTSCSGVPNRATIALQDSYLIYDCPTGRSGQQYGYTDLCSAYQNKELRWVHLTMGKSQFPGLTRVVFAVDHDLVMAVSIQQALGDHAALVELAFFEFSTGAPHPLSSTHTVSLPLSEFPQASVHAEVLSDHVLVSVSNIRCKAVVYLVSWKKGTLTLLRSLPERSITFGTLVVVPMNSGLVSLIDDSENRLEICKLELDPGPRLQTLCFLELPTLAPGASHCFLGACGEWVPTSKSYTRTRSSRGYHVPFYTSEIGTIALHFQYQPQLKPVCSESYVLIISVTALVSVIPTDVRNVPWEDWGPSSTHLFTFSRAKLTSLGPFWITDYRSPGVRQYDLRRTRYTQLMPGNKSLLQSRPTIVHLSDIFQYDIETHLPYRDVMMGDKDLYQATCIMADREWVVGVRYPYVGAGSSPSVTVYHVG